MREVSLKAFTYGAYPGVPRGKGGVLVMSEVPLCPPLHERAPRPVALSVEEWLQSHYLEARTRRYVASRPPSDMPSTPAAPASPLASAEKKGFGV